MNPAEIMAHQPTSPLPIIPRRRGPGKTLGAKADAIVMAFARRNGMSFEEIKSKSKLFRIAHARQGAMFELYATGEYSYPTIGAYFDLDQSSIRHGVHSYAAWLRAHEARGGGA